MERQRIEDREINVVSVTVITSTASDDYQLFLDHMIGTLDIRAGGDIELINESIAESLADLRLPADGVTQLLLKESGEWGDPHWVKYYVIERIVRVS